LYKGCGVWNDDGRIVIFTGEYFINIDTKKVYDISEFKSKYLYEMNSDIEIDDFANVLSQEEITGIVDSIKRLKFQESASNDFLIGWIVASLIGGILHWRPHIYITGSPGAGKSTINEMILKKLFGNFNVNPTSSSGNTFPSIRNLISGVTYPVVIDEAESKKKIENSHINEIMDCARAVSTYNEKGNFITNAKDSNGNNNYYLISSMFCLIGVNPAITDEADYRRWSRLEFKGEKNPESWQDDRFFIETNCTQSLGIKFRNFVWNNTRAITKNIDNFRIVTGRHTKSQITGDQIGTLLGARWSLANMKIYTDDEIESILKNYDIRPEIISNKISEANESITTLNAIFDTIIPGIKQTTIKREMIEFAGVLKSKDYTKNEYVNDRKAFFSVYGIALSRCMRYIYIRVNNHGPLQKLVESAGLKNCGYSDSLKRLPEEYIWRRQKTDSFIVKANFPGHGNWYAACIKFDSVIKLDSEETEDQENDDQLPF